MSKRQNHPLENGAEGGRDGYGRRYANLRGLRKCKMKAEGPLPRHFAARDGTVCGQAPPTGQPGDGKGLQNDSRFLYADGFQLEGKSYPKPYFPPLSAPFETALRQEIFVFAERIFFSCRKEIPFLSHENARRGGEMLHTDSSPAQFLTVRTLFAAFRFVTGMLTRQNSFPFDRKIHASCDNPTLCTAEDSLSY